MIPLPWRRLSRAGVAAFAGLCPLGLCLPALGLASPARAQLDDVLETSESGTRASAASQKRVDALSEATDDLVAAYRSELRQIDDLATYNRQLEDLLAAQRTELASLAEQIDRAELVGRRILPLMERMLATLEEFIGLDVPFLRTERAERVARLKALMARADVSTAEKYRRLLEAFQVESEYGRTIEAYRGPLEGEVVRNVDFLRIGRIALLYLTLDGEQLGAWDPRARAWVELPGSYRTAIRQGLRIARKQEAPDLLELPVPAPEPAP